MSLKNYKSFNFELNQPIFAEDMNNLVANDVLLYNQIKDLPRGIIGFAQCRHTHYGVVGSDIPVQTVDTARQAGGSNANAGASGFTFIQDRSKRPFVPLECSFEVEAQRLIELSAFFSRFIAPQANRTDKQAMFRIGFFLQRDDRVKWSLTNSPFMSSRIFYNNFYHGFSSSYVTKLEAGLYKFRVGIKTQNGAISCISGQNGLGQIAVEDLGAFIAPGQEVDNEF